MSDDERREDRRRSQRVKVEIEVDYRADDTFLFAYVTDISDMGIFVRTEDPLDPGARLTLRFSPKDEEPLEVEGEVRWKSDGSDGSNKGMGVQFLDLAASHRSRIMELVRAMAYLDAGDSD